jgi:hypothetical protein
LLERVKFVTKYLLENANRAINNSPHAGFSSVPYQHTNKSGTAFFEQDYEKNSLFIDGYNLYHAIAVLKNMVCHTREGGYLKPRFLHARKLRITTKGNKNELRAISKNLL